MARNKSINSDGLVSCKSTVPLRELQCEDYGKGEIPRKYQCQLLIGYNVGLPRVDRVTGCQLLCKTGSSDTYSRPCSIAVPCFYGIFPAIPGKHRLICGIAGPFRNGGRVGVTVRREMIAPPAATQRLGSVALSLM